MTHTNCCIYRVVPPDDEQLACSKHVEVIFFDVLLTVHRSIFISVFKQFDAQNLFHNKFYFMPLHVSNTCAHHQEVKIALHSLWYHHTYRWPSLNPCTRRPPIVKLILCIKLVYTEINVEVNYWNKLKVNSASRWFLLYGKTILGEKSRGKRLLWTHVNIGEDNIKINF